MNWDYFSDGWASGTMKCKVCDKTFENVRFKFSCHDKVEGVWPRCCRGDLAEYCKDWKPDIMYKTIKHPIGLPPKELGVFATPSKEMMYYLYLPIKFPKGYLHLPERLLFFEDIIEQCWQDCDDSVNKYAYLTVKTMFVGPNSSPNRPGWHIDGYASKGDINYIWANTNPTEFAVQDFVDIPEDDAQSMVEITKQVDPTKIVTYPNNTLLRLDESVVHRVAPNLEAGIRTFIKVTFSDHQFKNEGNSHNYLIDYDWDQKPRSLNRNIDHVR